MRKFTQEELNRATNAAPILVQEALVTDPFLDFELNLEKNYQLHVDTMGIVTQLMYELLIGLINPSEFFTGLQEAGIPSTTAQQLTKDLNDKVFMPLQEKMKNGGSKDPSEPSQLIPPAPARKQASYTAPVIAEPTVPVNTAPLPYVPPAPVMPAPRPIAPPVMAPSQEPEVRTMVSDMEMMQSGTFHEGSALPMTQAPSSAPAPAPVVRAPIPPAPPIPPVQSVPPAPVQFQPQTPPVPPIAVAPPAMPKAPAPQSQNREALHEILKSYGVDPYREPPE